MNFASLALSIIAILQYAVGSTLYNVNGDDGFLYVLSLKDPDGVGSNVDVGETQFNNLFYQSEHKILLVHCTGCSNWAKKMVYMKRYTCLDSVNLYFLTANWQTSDGNGCQNQLGVDFDLFYNLEDAINGTNAWQYCNYASGTGTGMFRDCGPVSAVGGWNMVGPASGPSLVKPGKFYIYAPEMMDPCAAYGESNGMENKCGCQSSCGESVDELYCSSTMDMFGVNELTNDALCPGNNNDTCCCCIACGYEEEVVNTTNSTAVAMDEVNGDSGFIYVLSLKDPDGTGNVDVGEDLFNELFWNSPYKILLVHCTGCTNNAKKFVYMKRYTCLDSVNLYYLTANWQTTDGNGCPNALGIDFDLFSSLQDAIDGTNAWTYCNYASVMGTGMFRDCGPTGNIGGWNIVGPESGPANVKPGKFYIYAPEEPDSCGAYGSLMDENNMCGCAESCDNYCLNLAYVEPVFGRNSSDDTKKNLCLDEKKSTCCCCSACLTDSPTTMPTLDPTSDPSMEPTMETMSPTPLPTEKTDSPTTSEPTKNPTTMDPTMSPTDNATVAKSTVEIPGEGDSAGCPRLVLVWCLLLVWLGYVWY